jgi:hypothetical protein
MFIVHRKDITSGDNFFFFSTVLMLMIFIKFEYSIALLPVLFFLSLQLILMIVMHVKWYAS